MLLPVPSADRPLRFRASVFLAVLFLAGLRAPAQTRLTASITQVVSGNQCELKAQGAPEGALQWSVLEPGGGTIAADAGGRVFYTAPSVVVPTSFKLRVAANADPAPLAELAIRVLPRIDGLPDLLAENLLPETLGPDWLTPVPRLSLFAGVAEPPAAGALPMFSRISSIRYADQDPDLGDLGGNWLVADARGLKRVSNQGQVTALPGLPDHLTALAVRPRVPAPGPQVVLAQQVPGFRWNGSGFRVHSPKGLIWALTADGSCQRLAGSDLQDPFDTDFQNGPALEARFGRISGLALAADGTLFVADAGHRLLRKISPEGLVSSVAGNRYLVTALLSPFPFSLSLAVDGHGSAARFCELRGLALDPASGHLYLADGHAIREVTPSGQVSTLLGSCLQPGFQPLPQDQPMPVGMPCLDDPEDLHLQGGQLFIADTGNHAIRIFNLGTRTLQTVVGHPDQPQHRLGPLRRFAPDLPLDACATLGSPASIAISPGGSCLVDLCHGLAHLDLHTLAPE